VLNTEIIIHPRLNHIGVTTDNLEPMIDWYRKVLGMTINHRSVAPIGAQNVGSLTAAWARNDEVNHASHWLSCRDSPPTRTDRVTSGCNMSRSNTRGVGGRRRRPRHAARLSAPLAGVSPGLPRFTRPEAPGLPPLPHASPAEAISVSNLPSCGFLKGNLIGMIGKGLSFHIMSLR
jgi:catechol 2,3-dioxygenase-like lactoylglutathione lyase family enzyme